MQQLDVLKDIAKRTGGDIYLGVVGAVRTGKSTFIKQFMEQLVIPNISSESDRVRATDELPHSGKGRTITTIEPKFIPNQAIEINVAEGLQVRVRMVDCVGYAIEGAQGYEDENGVRMISTPWCEEPIPFQEAAEIGTKKVIEEHATLGILMTTDGSIAGIPREAYEEAEERIVRELEAAGKPFIVVLNSAMPYSDDVQRLRSELHEKYDVPVLALDVANLREDETQLLLKEVLFEFPVHEVNVNLPSWVMVLNEGHWLRSKFENSVRDTINNIKRLRDVDEVVGHFDQYDFIESASLSNMDMGQGVAEIDLYAQEELYDQILTEIVGVEITGKDHLLEIMQGFTKAKKEYDMIADALAMVKSTGYGIASFVDGVTLEEPEIIKQGSRFGVKVKANAESIHMIKVNVESEFAPIIGSEQQGEALVKHLMQDFDKDPLKVLETDIFGCSLQQIIKESIQSKNAVFPDNARYKLQETLQRII
ncbi:MAG: stage sporulation protein, partial [Bacillota bacterium]